MGRSPFGGISPRQFLPTRQPDRVAIPSAFRPSGNRPVASLTRFENNRHPLGDRMLQITPTIRIEESELDERFVIDARRRRTQADNRQDARERLVALLRQAAVRPKPRRKTRPTMGSIERRAASKRRRAETKRRRGKIVGDD